ncbi:hypothetical protein EGT29_07825 [Pigmentiphaga sp. H8]|uniref:hypothetical protein n=1 Tax=unclassified Pigmentiphaga TaxID=2626614 RepID=UPI000F5B18DC|nr:hypothetical protein [Pigmentiphaga sp. H8]AZG07789.1 hypothetical protein EGT29_07825 [Pigmentiphaga sp. H8]
MAPAGGGMVMARMGRQRGQAMAEALLALGAFGALWVLGSALGRLQDLALQTEFAGRHLAFAVVQEAPQDVRERTHAYFFQPARHRWRNHDGSALLPDQPGRFSMQVRQEAGRLPEQAQPGGNTEPARMLRGELLPAHPGLVAGRVSVRPDLAPVARLGGWRTVAPLSSRFVILVDAGHARDDGDAQARIAGAPRAWSDAAQRTERAGRALSVLSRVDRPWGRPPPQFDWLSAWKGLLPAHLAGGAR